MEGARAATLVNFDVLATGSAESIGSAIADVSRARASAGLAGGQHPVTGDDASQESRASAQKLQDDLLLRLDALLEGDPMLERALDVVDRHLVTLAESPSGRSVFLVQSSLARQVTGAGGGMRRKSEAAPPAAMDAAASGLNALGCYTVMPQFCSCSDFTFSLLPSRRGRQLCKHTLAVAIAEATGRFTRRAVTDEELASLLEGAALALP
jgi:hypothetical protein